MLKKLILGSALLCSAAAQADVWKMVLAEGTGDKWSFKQNSLCAPAGDFGRESGFLHFEVKKGGVYRFAVEYQQTKGRRAAFAALLRAPDGEVVKFELIDWNKIISGKTPFVTA